MKRSLSIATLVLVNLTVGSLLLSLNSCTPVTTAQKTKSHNHGKQLKLAVLVQFIQP